jgi:hypothetical protein
LENKILEKLFSDAKIKSLQHYLDLSKQQESPPADPWLKLWQQRALVLTLLFPDEKGLSVLEYTWTLIRFYWKLTGWWDTS